MTKFQKTIYVTRTENDDEETPTEYFVELDKDFVSDEEEGTEVAIYQLVKIGRVVKSSKIVFERK